MKFIKIKILFSLMIIFGVSQLYGCCCPAMLNDGSAAASACSQLGDSGAKADTCTVSPVIYNCNGVQQAVYQDSKGNIVLPDKNGNCPCCGHDLTSNHYCSANKTPLSQIPVKQGCPAAGSSTCKD